MITITDNAVAKLRALNRRAIRVFLEKGGCATYKYGFSFATEAADLHTFQVGDIAVLVSADDVAKLSDVEIDYESNLIGEKFIITENPYAIEKCRCGISFSGQDD